MDSFGGYRLAGFDYSKAPMEWSYAPTSKVVEKFSDLSGDNNILHRSGVCKMVGLNNPIVHGALLLTEISRFFGEVGLMPTDYVCGVSSFSSRFKRPVPMQEMLHFSATLTSETDRNLTFQIVGRRHDKKVALEASVVLVKIPIVKPA
jgi:acyl dehydratase